jgi:hypothetical protein
VFVVILHVSVSAEVLGVEDHRLSKLSGVADGLGTETESQEGVLAFGHVEGVVNQAAQSVSCIVRVLVEEGVGHEVEVEFLSESTLTEYSIRGKTCSLLLFMIRKGLRMLGIS